MSIEDRVRAATRARTDLVRDIRPLELPGELPAPVRRAGPLAAGSTGALRSRARRWSPRWP